MSLMRKRSEEGAPVQEPPTEEPDREDPPTRGPGIEEPPQKTIPAFLGPISELVPVDPEQVLPVWQQPNVTTSLAASPHLLRVRGELLVSGSQVVQRLL